jgi:AbrB family looped-hinge helix DNA binding protein
MALLDAVNRVTIPKHLRDKYNLKAGEHYRLYDNGKTIEIIPEKQTYEILETDMTELRKLYLMLENSGLLDEYYDRILAGITKKSELKCEKCGNNLFYVDENTCKCFICK